MISLKIRSKPHPVLENTMLFILLRVVLSVHLSAYIFICANTIHPHPCATLQIHWNYIMELMTGYVAKEVLGKPLVEAFGFSRNEYVKRSHFLFIRNTPKMREYVCLPEGRLSVLVQKHRPAFCHTMIRL